MLALVTCAAARDFDTDLPILLGHLPEARVVDWHDPDVDWAAFRAVVVRSAWDYVDRLDDFLAWAARVDTVTNLWNPLATIEWNVDKRYLRALAAQGLPVVPTEFVEPGARPGGSVDLEAEGGVVVKPSVGAGSRWVRHVVGAAAATDAVAALHAEGRTALIQPYLADIDRVGESGLVYVGGEYSHGFHKVAILSKPVEFEAGSLFARESVGPRTPAAAERALADEIVAGLGPTAYARVDLLPAPDGPVLLELELTEPSLFLTTTPGAGEHTAAVFRSLAG